MYLKNRQLKKSYVRPFHCPFVTKKPAAEKIIFCPSVNKMTAQQKTAPQGGMPFDYAGIKIYLTTLTALLP